MVQGCVHVGDEALYQLARRASRLQLVNLQGCRQVGTLSTMQGTTLTVQITDEGIAELAESSPALHYLCISTCVNLTDASLVALGRHCGQLVTIECAGVSQLTDHGFQVLHASATVLYWTVQALTRGCPRLSRMDLDECVLITDSTLASLAQHATALQVLTLHHHSLSIS